LYINCKHLNLANSFIKLTMLFQPLRKAFAFTLFLALGHCISAQVGIGTVTPSSKLEVVGTGTTSSTTAMKVGNSSSAILTVRNDGLVEVSSTTQGFLPPRMTTTQRDLISSPATGLVIFNTTTNSLETKKSTGWVSLSESFVALPTVVIGTQQWMEKNLEVSTYRDGTVIPEVTDPTAWLALTTGAWCYYNNDPLNGAIYGKLYNWYAVNDSRGLCPAGWHVPTISEWTTLSTLLGGDAVAGGKMKTPGTTRWSGSNLSATNSSGFAGLPGGSRSNIFEDVGNKAYWWSSSQGTHDVWARSLISSHGYISVVGSFPDYGYSVRCIRD
jgi:uncharacterized protein (TIGR02145 family)